MLHITAMKNISLTQKIEFISKRTTREKLLAYLSSEAQKAGSNRFSIPFNRQELADYLSVDRSAMSAELSKLRKEGILNYNKTILNYCNLISIINHYKFNHHKFLITINCPQYEIHHIINAKFYIP